MPRECLQSVIVVSPDRTPLLVWKYPGEQTKRDGYLETTGKLLLLLHWIKFLTLFQHLNIASVVCLLASLFVF